MKAAMRYLIALLAIAGIIDSALALRIHYQDPNAAPPCAVTEKFDCGAVNHSRFAVFPPTSFDEAPDAKKIHIPVAIFGILGYALITVLALWPAPLTGRYFFLLQVSEVGFAFAAFLTYMEDYILQKWCIYCIWSQGLITAILLISLFAFFSNARKKMTAIRRSLDTQ
jgi:uncharacterized membrane protein